MTHIHEEERAFSLSRAFARALGRLGCHPPSLVRQQFVDAVITGDTVIAGKILQMHSGASLLHALGDDGLDHTLFELALGEGKFDMADVMINRWPQILAHNFGYEGAPDNRTILMQRCIMSDGGDEIQFLIDRKADVSAKDGKGDTPLHFAARLQKDRTAKLLLGAQPDVNAANNEGVTPVMDATKGNECGMLDAIVAAGGDVHAVDKKGLNAAMHAIYNSNLPATRRLMELGAKIDFSDPAVATLCRVATLEGDLSFVMELGQHEQKAMQKEKTPFDYAGTLDKGLAEGITVSRPLKLKGRAP